jgi:hypothetical protein
LAEGDREYDRPDHGAESLDLGTVVQGLIASGWQFKDLLWIRQRGVPYRGVTVPQLWYFAEREQKRLNNITATATEALIAAIGSVFDESTGKEVHSWIKGLRNA